ncbi:MAG TPA: phosphatase PAP2 family protein, partial [Sphingobacteriaceae bacterium]
GLSNPFFDWLMPYLRNRYFWIPLYLFLVIFFVMNYKKAGIAITLFLLITFGISDYSASSVVKPAFERLRPCNDPVFKTEVNTRIACGSGYSMPSSHAANHFAIAVFLITLFYRRWKWILPLALLWATAISFAQIYVGVHYPFDVLIGGILGSIVGYLTATIFIATQAEKKWNSGN